MPVVIMKNLTVEITAAEWLLVERHCARCGISKQAWLRDALGPALAKIRREDVNAVIKELKTQ